jgi:hypothetical protein
MWIWTSVQLEQLSICKFDNIHKIQQSKHLDATQTWSKYAPPLIWAKARASQELIQTHTNKTKLFWIILLESKCIQIHWIQMHFDNDFFCVNPLVVIMGCIFVVRPLIDNNINVATIALRQLTCFWRISNLGGKNLSFFSIVEQ